MVLAACYLTTTLFFLAPIFDEPVPMVLYIGPAVAGIARVVSTLLPVKTQKKLDRRKLQEKERPDTTELQWRDRPEEGPKIFIINGWGTPVSCSPSSASFSMLPAI